MNCNGLWKEEAVKSPCNNAEIKTLLAAGDGIFLLTNFKDQCQWHSCGARSELCDHSLL